MWAEFNFKRRCAPAIGNVRLSNLLTLGDFICTQKNKRTPKHCCAQCFLSTSPQTPRSTDISIKMRGFTLSTLCFECCIDVVNQFDNSCSAYSRCAFVIYLTDYSPICCVGQSVVLLCLGLLFNRKVIFHPQRVLRVHSIEKHGNHHIVMNSLCNMAQQAHWCTRAPFSRASGRIAAHDGTATMILARFYIDLGRGHLESKDFAKEHLSS